MKESIDKGWIVSTYLKKDRAANKIEAWKRLYHEVLIEPLLQTSNEGRGEGYPPLRPVYPFAILFVLCSNLTATP